MDRPTPNCPMHGTEMEVRGNLAICVEADPQDHGIPAAPCQLVLQWGKCEQCGDQTWIEVPPANPESGPSPRDLDPCHCLRCISDEAYGIVEIACQTPRCGWVADKPELLAEIMESGDPDASFSCPKCGVDESGLDITRIGDLRLNYRMSIRMPDGQVMPLHWKNEPKTPARVMETFTKMVTDPKAFEGYTLLLTPVEFQLRWYPEAEPGSGYCKHGTYVGGIGIDWMCGQCEQDDGSRWFDVYWHEIEA